MAGLQQGVEAIETLGIGSALFRTMLLSAMIHGFKATDLYSNQGGKNLLNGSAHFHVIYGCADG